MVPEIYTGHLRAFKGCITALPARVAQWFVAFSMVVPALLKLQNVESCATMFLYDDLLAQRWVPYSRIGPFAKGAAGVPRPRTLVSTLYIESLPAQPKAAGSEQGKEKTMRSDFARHHRQILFPRVQEQIACAILSQAMRLA